MNEENHEGGCLCGGVRYSVTGTPLSRAICHCVSCRKSAGAQSVAWIVFPYAGFSFVSDAPTVHRSSPEVSRTFCGECGTSLTYQHDESPDTIDITAASLDFPDEFPPTHHVWMEDKLMWESVSDGLAQFERDGSPDQEA